MDDVVIESSGTVRSMTFQEGVVGGEEKNRRRRRGGGWRGGWWTPVLRAHAPAASLPRPFGAATVRLRGC